MSEFIKIFEIAVWPLVAILAMLLFGGAIRSFLRYASVRKVKIFGMEIETTGAKIAEVISENFNYFKPTHKQRDFLDQLAKRQGGIPKDEALNMGLDYKDGLRPLRNAGLMRGDGATIKKSNHLLITPLGEFLVTNAINNYTKTVDVKSIDVKGSAEENQ